MTLDKEDIAAMEGAMMETLRMFFNGAVHFPDTEEEQAEDQYDGGGDEDDSLAGKPESEGSPMDESVEDPTDTESQTPTPSALLKKKPAVTIAVGIGKSADNLAKMRAALRK